MHHPTYRVTRTTAFVTPVLENWLEREIYQWVHHEGLFRRPIAPWARHTYREREREIEIIWTDWWFCAAQTQWRNSGGAWGAMSPHSQHGPPLPPSPIWLLIVHPSLRCRPLGPPDEGLASPLPPPPQKIFLKIRHCSNPSSVRRVLCFRRLSNISKTVLSLSINPSILLNLSVVLLTTS